MASLYAHVYGVTEAGAGCHEVVVTLLIIACSNVHQQNCYWPRMRRSSPCCLLPLSTNRACRQQVDSMEAAARPIMPISIRQDSASGCSKMRICRSQTVQVTCRSPASLSNLPKINDPYKYSRVFGREHISNIMNDSVSLTYQIWWFQNSTD